MALSEKEIINLLTQCTKDAESYKKHGTEVVKACSVGSQTPFKVQQCVIDQIKIVIKSPPKKQSATQKFYALKILNKIVMQKTPHKELIKYVEDNILERLEILAEHNN